jgi:hypothetical protein
VIESSVRMLKPADAGAARALVSASFAGTRYEARMLEQLEVAIGGEDDECRALVAIAHASELSGVALAGTVAGAHSVVKLHALIGDDQITLRALARAVTEGSARASARMVVCEVADDVPFRVTVEVLLELGYEEAGRVADFVRDGVALRILTWRSQ